jgi:hypothetical protein
MKRMVVVVLSLVSLAALAQTDTIEQGRAEIISGRMGMVEASMQLTAAQGDIFWPLYREYVEEQVSLLDERIQLLKDFRDNYQQMTAEGARAIAERSFAIQRARTGRRERYFEIFAEALDPIVAARFIQVDSRISTLMDHEMNRAIPLIAPPSE